jgi:hypothetical protein
MSRTVVDGFLESFDCLQCARAACVLVDLQFFDDSLRVDQALSHVRLVRFEDAARQLRIAAVKNLLHLRQRHVERAQPRHDSRVSKLIDRVDAIPAVRIDARRNENARFGYAQRFDRDRTRAREHADRSVFHGSTALSGTVERAFHRLRPLFHHRLDVTRDFVG